MSVLISGHGGSLNKVRDFSIATRVPIRQGYCFETLTGFNNTIYEYLMIQWPRLAVLSTAWLTAGNVLPLDTNSPSPAQAYRQVLNAVAKQRLATTVALAMSLRSIVKDA